MKRNIITIIILFLFSFSISNSYTFASSKPGGTCSKKGLKIVISKKQYVCTKAGEKLIWKVVSNASKPIASPTPIPSPSNDEKWLAAAKSISNSARDGSESHLVSKIYVSDYFDKEIMNGLLEYQKIASHYWLERGISIPGKLEAVFLTEKDELWFDQNIQINAPVVKDFINRFDADLYFNGTVLVDRIPANRFVIVYFVGSNYKYSQKYTSVTINWKSALATMATHEYQHLVQYTRTLVTSGINLQSRLPCWFNEGFAAFYEDAFYLNTDPKKVFYLQNSSNNQNEIQNIRDVRNSSVVRSTKNYIELVTDVSLWSIFLMNNYSQDQVCRDTGYGYNLGKIFVEKLYLDFGSEGIINLLDSYKSTKDFSSAFTFTFGIGDKVWVREKAIPYFVSQLKIP